MSTNSFTSKITPNQHAFVLHYNLDLADDLSCVGLKPFDPSLKFAGRSKRGNKILCFDKPGPARIGGVDVVIKLPSGFLCVDGCNNIPLSTPNPRLVIYVAAYNEYLCIHKDDLLPRFKIREYGKIAPGKETESLKLDVALALHRKYKNIIMAQTSWDYSCYIPLELNMTDAEWESVERKLVHGKAVGAYKHTVEISQNNPTTLWFSGLSLAEIKNTWGVTGLAEYFSKGRIGFEWVKILDPIKAGKQHKLFGLYPEVRTVDRSMNYFEIPVESFLRGPFRDSKVISVSDSKLDKVCIPRTDETISCLTTPIFDTNSQKVYCPAKLVDTALMPMTSASRKYDCRDAEKFNLRTKIKEDSNSNAWYLDVRSLSKLPLRDKKAEKERLEKLTAEVEAAGFEIPKNLAKHTQKEIDSFLDLRRRVQAGELILEENCPYIPHQADHDFHEWLEDRKMLHICPITSDAFVKNIQSIDELVNLPKFMEELETLVGDMDFFKQLMLSDKFRAKFIGDLL